MKQNAVTGLRCVKCGRIYAEQLDLYTCSDCGIEGILDIEYDYDQVRPALNRGTLANNRTMSIWRYLPVLPIGRDARLPTLQLGWTPIYEAPKLAQELGLAGLLIKDDGRNPTGSFKDRASAIGVTRATELGRATISVASTGNAASSLAGFAANMGLRAFIFVPQTAPEAKVTQLLVYGATVFTVRGSYDQAYRLAMSAAQTFGWYNRNCAINAYLVEGKKTCGLEIGEQLHANLPDVVAVAVGDGCTIAGIGKGLAEMKALGIIERVPRLLGVQAEGAAPITICYHQAYAGASLARDSYHRPGSSPQQPFSPLPMVEAQTVADSIAVGQPRNATKAMRAVAASAGDFITVSDEQILAAIPRLAQATGVFAEPAGAASLAGVIAAREAGLIRPHERVLVVATGNGLKDIKSARKAVGQPYIVAPNLEDVRAALAGTAAPAGT
jgi:threonine synthase